MKKLKYLLDSYALLAYFQAEPAGAAVRNILKDASSNHVLAFLSVISLGEIYYIIARKIGEEKAGASVKDISCLPIGLIDVTTKRVLAAAPCESAASCLLRGCICRGNGCGIFGHNRHRRSRIQGN